MAVPEQGGKFIQCIKHGAEVSGISQGPMRPPWKGLNQEENREPEQVIATVKTTVAAILQAN